MNTIATIKRIAASTAIAGALSVAGLGLANGIAAAAPAPGGDHAGPGTSSSSSEVHAHLIPGFKPLPPAGTEGPAIPAHLIPGFTPKPIQIRTAPSAADDGFDPTNPENCHSAGCREVIDE